LATGRDNKFFLIKSYKRITKFLKKNRSNLINNLLKLLYKFIINYVPVFSIFFVSLILECKFHREVGELTWRSALQNLKIDSWIIIFVAPIVIIIFNSLQQKKKLGKKIIHHLIIYRLMGSAINDLIKKTPWIKNSVGRIKKHYRREYRIQLLTRIAKAIEIIIREAGVEVGQIGANYMIVDKDSMTLIWDTDTPSYAYRENKSLPINQNFPLPGAPSAYITATPVYINNTLSPEMRQYFDKYNDYRSRISYPIIDESNIVYAVVNIDSTVSDQFISREFVGDYITPIIQPFMDLFYLKRKIAKFL